MTPSLGQEKAKYVPDTEMMLLPLDKNKFRWDQKQSHKANT